MRCLIVIQAADRDRANQDALQWDPEGGAQSFTVGLSPTGEEPATHYWASAGALSEEVYAGIAALVAAAYPDAHCEAWDLEQDPGRPAALLAELGLRRIEREGM